MADLDRTFKKPSVDEEGTLMQLIEGEWDGALELDGPYFKVNSIRMFRNPKRIEIELLFEAEQGSRTDSHSRYLKFMYADLPGGAKTKLKDFHDWIVDQIIKQRPELSDGVEQ